MAKILTVVGEGVWETDNTGVVTFTPEEGFYKSPTPIKYSAKSLDGTLSNLSTIAAKYIAQAPQIGSIAYIGATEDDGSSSAESLITGTKYYFSTSGDDANDGLSPATPKQTIYRMQILFNSMNAGDGIMLKRGDVWDGDNFGYSNLGYSVQGTESNPKVLTCYGVGARPRIDRTKTQTPTWTQEANGMWSSDVTELTSKKIRHVLVDGVMTREASTLQYLVDNTATRDWFYDTSSHKMYFAEDPAGKTVQWSDSNTVLYFSTGTSHIVIDNIDMMGTRGINLSIPLGGTNVKVQNCTLGKYSYSGVSISTVNSVVDNCIVDSGMENFPNDDPNYIPETSYGFEGITARMSSTSETDKGIIVKNCTVKDFWHTNVLIGVDPQADTAEWNWNPKIYNCIINGDNIYYGGGISVQYRIDGVEVYNNTFNKADAHQISGNNGHYHHNILQNKITSHLTLTHYNHGGGFHTNVQEIGFSNNIIENNMFFNCEGVGVNFANKFGYPYINNTIRNNIFVDTGLLPCVYNGSAEDIAIRILLDDDINNTIVENNIVFNNRGNNKTIYTWSDESTIDQSKLFTPEEANNASFTKGTIFRNNSYADPKLSNYGTDYKPTVTSPIYGVGAATTATKDIVGQNIDTPVNVGIYGKNQMENV